MLVSPGTLAAVYVWLAYFQFSSTTREVVFELQVCTYSNYFFGKTSEGRLQTGQRLRGDKIYR